MDKTLILTVGLPRSGKSTWARSTGYPIVNPDSIRMALHGNAFLEQAEPFVWAIAYSMARALFLAGHDHVVVDATNVTRARRAEWEYRFKDCAVMYKVFDTPKGTCIDRAIEDGRSDLVPIIERMFQSRNMDPEYSLTEARYVFRQETLFDG